MGQCPSLGECYCIAEIDSRRGRRRASEARNAPTERVFGHPDDIKVTALSDRIGQLTKMLKVLRVHCSLLFRRTIDRRYLPIDSIEYIQLMVSELLAQQQRRLLILSEYAYTGQ